MTIEEAIVDPKRPLSISPRDWVLSVEAELEEEKSLVGESALRIASENSSSKGREPIGWEKIDLGIDQMVEGCKIMDQGISEVEGENLTPESRKTVMILKELMERAIIPYLEDVLEASEGATSHE